MSELNNVPAAFSVLADAVPEAVAGYRLIREVIEADGALSAAEKALIVAVMASIRADGEMAAAELTRGRTAGLNDDQILAGAAALLLSRGQSACARLLGAAGEVRPQGPPAPASERGAREYFLGYYQADALPARQALLAEHAAPVFEAYFRMHHAALRARRQFAKLSELILCAIQAADLQPDFVAVHAEGARRVGATERELLEAIVCAMPVAGVGAWAAGSGALRLSGCAGADAGQVP